MNFDPDAEMRARIEALAKVRAAPLAPETARVIDAIGCWTWERVAALLAPKSIPLWRAPSTGTPPTTEWVRFSVHYSKEWWLQPDWLHRTRASNVQINLSVACTGAGNETIVDDIADLISIPFREGQRVMDAPPIALVGFSRSPDGQYDSRRTWRHLYLDFNLV